MKICDICDRRINSPYSHMTSVVEGYLHSETEWEFCDEHAIMIVGFLKNLRMEVSSLTRKKA
jgi:hypothetical protein